MRTVLAGFTFVAIALGGCGQSGEKTAAKRPSSTGTPEATANPAGRCPNQTKRVTAEALVPDPAPGYSLVPSDPAATKTIVTPLKTALGDRWRDHDEKVLARDGASSGTLLLVINSTETTGGIGDIVAGLLKGASEGGYKTEPITIRGQDTQLVRTADDSYMTVGVAGECAVVMLISASEEEVRGAVKQID
jgi:hypothetical protein